MSCYIYILSLPLPLPPLLLFITPSKPFHRFPSLPSYFPFFLHPFHSSLFPYSFIPSLLSFCHSYVRIFSSLFHFFTYNFLFPSFLCFHPSFLWFSFISLLIDFSLFLYPQLSLPSFLLYNSCHFSSSPLTSSTKTNVLFFFKGDYTVTNHLRIHPYLTLSVYVLPEFCLRYEGDSWVHKSSTSLSTLTDGYR